MIFSAYCGSNRGFWLSAWAKLKFVMVAVLLFATIRSSFAQVPEACISESGIGSPIPSTTCGQGSPVTVLEDFQLPNGLSYRKFSCGISYESLPSPRRRRAVCERRVTSIFHEISIGQGQELQLYALHNPWAHIDHACRNDYGGPAMAEVIQRQSLFDVVGATNGNYFIPDGAQFKPRGFLWSTRVLGNIGLHGKRVFVADQAGNHEVSIEPVVCPQNNNLVCAVVTACDNDSLRALGVLNLPSHAMGTYEFVLFLRHLFPTMTLAAQFNTSLLHGQWGRGGNLFEVDPQNPSEVIPHYSRCTSARRRDPAQRWKCERTSRTALCGREDGGISLLTMDSAYMYDMAVGLSPGGPCGLNCRYLYSLDGGGSSQLGVQLPASSDGAHSAFTVLYGQPTGDDNRSCGVYRAVDHLFVIGRYLR